MKLLSFADIVNIDLDEGSIAISQSVRNLGFMFDEKLILKVIYRKW